MVRIFFDSSSFFKRYVSETGSGEVARLCLRADEIGLCILCVPEFVSALCRVHREGRISPHRMRASRTAFFSDIRDASICDLTPPVVGKAVDLLEQHVLRAMDAIHVACALEWKADVFVSGDKRQLAAAQTAGLETVAV